MICLFHFPSLQPCIDTTLFASMQSFIHTKFEVASMQLHRHKVASMRLFQNCTENSTYRGVPFYYFIDTSQPELFLGKILGRFKLKIAEIAAPNDVQATSLLMMLLLGINWMKLLPLRGLKPEKNVAVQLDTLWCGQKVVQPPRKKLRSPCENWRHINLSPLAKKSKEKRNRQFERQKPP